jgi:hypothetical protein
MDVPPPGANRPSIDDIISIGTNGAECQTPQTRQDDNQMRQEDLIKLICGTDFADHNRDPYIRASRKKFYMKVSEVCHNCVDEIELP